MGSDRERERWVIGAGPLRTSASERKRSGRSANPPPPYDEFPLRFRMHAPPIRQCLFIREFGRFFTHWVGI